MQGEDPTFDHETTRSPKAVDQMSTENTVIKYPADDLRHYSDLLELVNYLLHVFRQRSRERVRSAGAAHQKKGSIDSTRLRSSDL
jgi:hypothetical protein